MKNNNIKVRLERAKEGSKENSFLSAEEMKIKLAGEGLNEEVLMFIHSQVAGMYLTEDGKKLIKRWERILWT
ncbi:hypothetical protein [Shouchella patagoniensis]|uniref:hypothetical protein n=1 Tax=Shouchella patagoniensis TaxID=228576 RepID=UPI000994C098|nr:hypothetical protein [Shouchella patagoniensis]